MKLLVQLDARMALGFGSIWYSTENQHMKDLEFFNRIPLVAAISLPRSDLTPVDPLQTYGTLAEPVETTYFN